MVIYNQHENIMASEAISSWSNTVQEFQFSTEEFYDLLDAKIKERELPDVKTCTRNISQGGLFSKNRLYFEARRKDYTFHICAAPYGKDYFFSWYLRVKLHPIWELLSRIPIIGAFFDAKLTYKTYYQLDTESMFKQSIHHVVTSTIDDILEPKGKRLSELDRRMNNA